jgi:hypothetical protein
MSKMFELLKEGLNDIIEYQQGKNKLKKRVIDFPKPATAFNFEENVHNKFILESLQIK